MIHYDPDETTCLNAAGGGDSEAFAQLSDPYFDAIAEATDSVWVDPKGDWMER